MFKYQVWYKDKIYGELCKASGRITATSSSEAKVCIQSFYENVMHITLTPILMEDSLEFDKEWDI